MKVKVLVRSEGYNRIGFVFEDMPSASSFMNVAMKTAEHEVDFEVEPIYPKPVTEETTEEGDEE